MEVPHIKLTLPTPPSVNGLFSGTARRFKSPKYKEWIAEATISLMSQKKYTIKGDNWLEVEYVFYFPIHNKNGTKKRKDTFNYEKALSDLLESQIEGFEDHLIIKGTVEKVDSPRNEVEVMIYESPALYDDLSTIA